MATTSVAVLTCMAARVTPISHGTDCLPLTAMCCQGGEDTPIEYLTTKHMSPVQLSPSLASYLTSSDLHGNPCGIVTTALYSSIMQQVITTPIPARGTVQ